MVDKFITNMKTPIDFKTEVGQGNDAAQLKIIGQFGLAVAVFISSMLVIPNPSTGRLAIFVLALVIGSISLLMMKLGSKGRLSK